MSARVLVIGALAALSTLMPLRAGAQDLAADLQEAASHRVWIADYLRLYDELLTMQAALGQISGAQADDRLAAAGRELYEQGYHDQDLDALREALRATADRFLASVEHEIATSTRWPTDLPAESYRWLATQLLGSIRGELEGTLASGGDPAASLHSATRLLALARGYEALPPELDYFAAVRERAAAAMPSIELATATGAPASSPPPAPLATTTRVVLRGGTVEADARLVGRGSTDVVGRSNRLRGDGQPDTEIVLRIHAPWMVLHEIEVRNEPASGASLQGRMANRALGTWSTQPGNRRPLLGVVSEGRLLNRRNGSVSGLVLGEHGTVSLYLQDDGQLERTVEPGVIRITFAGGETATIPIAPTVLAPVGGRPGGVTQPAPGAGGRTPPVILTALPPRGGVRPPTAGMPPTASLPPAMPPVGGRPPVVGGVPPSAATTTWGTTAAGHRGKDGQRFRYDCPPGGAVASVWGTDVYTDDSSICTAAVHAGLITFAAGGAVVIEIRPGQSAYQGMERYGVTTGNYQSWSGSFVFAGAAGGVTPPPVFAGTIQTDRASYAQGETVSVSFAGFPGTNDWIAIAPVGAAPESYGEWKWTDRRASGVLTFTAPAPGSYEVRVFADWSNGGYTVRARRAFTVVAAPPPPPIEPPAPTFTSLPADFPRQWQWESQGGWTGSWTRRGASDQFDASYRGPSGEQVTTVEELTRRGERIRGRRLSSSDNVLCNLDGALSGPPDSPAIEGTGECPGLNAGWWWRLRMGAPSPPAFAGSVRTERSSYDEGETIQVVFEGFPGTWDWITIAPADAAPESYGEWFWTDGSNRAGQPQGTPRRDGTLTFAGLSPGEYEVRAFVDWPGGGYTVRASHRFRVEATRVPQDIVIAHGAAWIGLDADVVGKGAAGVPDGEADAHFQLDIDINMRYELRSIAVYSSDAEGNPTGGQVWHSKNGGNWVLGVAHRGARINDRHVESLGRYENYRQFDLYAANSGGFNPGQHFVVEADVGMNEPLRTVVQIPGSGPPPGTPTLAARWCSGGNPNAQVSVTQSGGDLVLVNEFGMQTRGAFESATTIVTYDWPTRGLRGTVSGDGTRIEWENGSWWGPCGAGPTPTAAFAGWVRTAEEAYRHGEPITVHFGDFPGTADWITIAAAGASPESYGEWYWTDGSSSTGGPSGAPRRQGTLTFAGLQPGSYEVRAYADWPDGGYTIRARHAFVVHPGDAVHPPSPTGEPVSQPAVAAGRNAALGRPARQSSTSEWSHENDAQGAVDGEKNGRYGFHTEIEENPWWSVDLGEVVPLREIRVFNRLDCCPERSRTLHVYLSADNENWQLAYAHDGTPFGGTDGSPLVIDLRGSSARWVMLRLAESNYLHLDEVEIDHDRP